MDDLTVSAGTEPTEEHAVVMAQLPRNARFAADLRADAEAALARLAEEERRLTVARGETEAQLRGINSRLAAIAGERAAWAARAGYAWCRTCGREVHVRAGWLVRHGPGRGGALFCRASGEVPDTAAELGDCPPELRRLAGGAIEPEVPF